MTSAVKPNGHPSLLAPNFRLVGDLENSGDLQIDGQVEGNVKSQRLLVGETGQIKGKIEAEEVSIAGRIEGEVKAMKLHFAKTARFEGKLIYQMLVVEEGAEITGQCEVKTWHARKESEIPTLVEA